MSASSTPSTQINAAVAGHAVANIANLINDIDDANWDLAKRVALAGTGSAFGDTFGHRVAVGSREHGGAWIVWSDRDGAWTKLFGTQDVLYCTEFSTEGVPEGTGQLECVTDEEGTRYY